MPIAFKHIHDGAGVVYIGEGTVSGDDLQQANANVYQTEAMIRRIKFIFNDFSRVTGTSMTSEELRCSVQQDKAAAAINPDVVVAIVASSELVYGMSRMWEGMADEMAWEAFTTKSISAAKRWVKDKTGLEVVDDLER